MFQAQGNFHEKNKMEEDALRERSTLIWLFPSRIGLDDLQLEINEKVDNNVYRKARSIIS